jgi:tetratricopeptide (TPR) repeat protein
MIRELAYKVAFEILPKEQSPAGTWEAFREITEAISHFIKYFRTQLIDELHEADKHLQKAKECDCRLVKQAGKKSEVLADFFYKIGLSYRLRQEYNDAEKCMNLALETDSNRENYHYYYNGLGNIYWRLEKPKDAKFQYCHSIHRINYIKQLRQDCKKIILNNATIWLWFKEHTEFCFYSSVLPLIRWMAKKHWIREIPQSIKQKALIFPYPYNGLGNFYFEAGDFNNAEDHYTQAMALPDLR